jgi:hypothetical protein
MKTLPARFNPQSEVEIRERILKTRMVRNFWIEISYQLQLWTKCEWFQFLSIQSAVGLAAIRAKTPVFRGILVVALLAIGSVWKVAAQSPLSSEVVPKLAPGAQGGPAIRFVENEHDFGKIGSGVSTKFDFAFTNTGTENLEVLAVRPACGCTVAGDWTKSVAPGESGIIPIQFNSGNFSGPIHKTVTVTCNTSAPAETVLNFKGTVIKDVDVSPTLVVFTPQAGSQTTEPKSVRIVNHTDMPMELSPPESTNPAFSAEIKTLKEGKEFEVLVTAKPPVVPGTIQGAITMKTSFPNMPVITVNSIVMVQQAITVSPPQLMLGPIPLAADTQLQMTVRNGGSFPLTLSELSVSIPGVEATLKELQPGRLFNITLDFPAGFVIGPGTRPELSVKTSDTQFPILRVPILQNPKAYRSQLLEPLPHSVVTGAVAIPGSPTPSEDQSSGR